MTNIISGKKISDDFLKKIKIKIEKLKKTGIIPRLDVILVGNDTASEIYVRNKIKICDKVGIVSHSYRLEKTSDQECLIKLIKKLNSDDSVNGILCQFPLPSHMNADRVIEEISPNKDVDGLHPLNIGYNSMGRAGFTPCTPLGIMKLLKYCKIDISGANVVIIGRSNLVGRPLASLLSQKGNDATVTICHSRTKNIGDITRRADIIISAIGIAEYINGDMLKENCVVVDVGINRKEGKEKTKKIYGDVLFEEASKKASYITPVPGGVGPMTIAMLMYNTVNATLKQRGIKPLKF